MLASSLLQRRSQSCFSALAFRITVALTFSSLVKAGHFNCAQHHGPAPPLDQSVAFHRDPATYDKPIWYFDLTQGSTTSPQASKYDHNMFQITVKDAVILSIASSPLDKKAVNGKYIISFYGDDDRVIRSFYITGFDTCGITLENTNLASLNSVMLYQYASN